MKEYKITVFNLNTLETFDEFIAEFESITELRKFMEQELHNYSENYTNLDYQF